MLRPHLPHLVAQVSQFNLRDGCVIMAMKSAEGHLVLTGFCKVKKVRLAVVLDMMSGADSRHLQKELSQR